MTFDPLDPKL